MRRAHILIHALYLLFLGLGCNSHGANVTKQVGFDTARTTTSGRGPILPHESRSKGDILYAEDLLLQYRHELINNVIPFWTKYAVDWENGGLNTCITDEGKVLSDDKYMWSQLRAIWAFSALYNRIERRQEWLDIALHVFEFVKEYGRDNDGNWVYSVSSDGVVIKGAISIYTDGFAIEALMELARATGSKEAIQMATETYHNVKKRLSRPGSYPTAPLPIPQGSKSHGIAMIFSKVFNDLGNYLNNVEIIEESHILSNEVMDVFRRPERKRIFEFVNLDNTLMTAQPGFTNVPGHALESMWFMIHIYQQSGQQIRVQQAIESIRWHIELGWDDVYGGVVAALDADGSFWENQSDHKLWWVQAEALYSLLLAYSVSKDTFFLDWFMRVHDYTFNHYPVPRFGEWFQRLDREGNHVKNIVALPVKDPYHVIRSLMNCIAILEEIAYSEQ